MAGEVLGVGERQTERLLLTPIGRSHVEALLSLHADPGVARWNGGFWSRDQAVAFALDMEARWRHDGVGKWLAYSSRDGQLVGRGGLSLRPILGQLQLEVGWQLREQLWGRGFATEIGREALRFAFDELGAGQVIAFTEVHNVDSRRVAQRIGMNFVQEFRHRGFAPVVAEDADETPFALYRIGRPGVTAAEQGRR